MKSWVGVTASLDGLVCRIAKNVVAREGRSRGRHGWNVGKRCNLPTDTIFVKLDFLPWLAQYTVFNEIETFL